MRFSIGAAIAAEEKRRTEMKKELNTTMFAFTKERRGIKGQQKKIGLLEPIETRTGSTGLSEENRRPDLKEKEIGST
jgi:hypothetical protein